ncbi:MAG: ElyC/SanA/YdcF family protein [Clostridia bacterium]
MKKAIIAILAAVAACILFVLAVNLAVVSEARKHMLADGYGPVDAVLVLGAYVSPSGQPCPMLADRLDTGLEAIGAGVSKKILLSGDNGTKGYDEVNAMKNHVLSAGMEPQDVFLDHAGFSTYESIYRAREIFEVGSVAISTQEFHLYRAVYIARRMGMEAYGIPADRRTYPPNELKYYEFREILARVKDFMLVNVFKTKPTFLGEKFPITGDGRTTFD